ncbi:hypothetical protein AJ78_02669 [Emergomyces pasteurianus Ep9510]|uniref:Required for respiratory growth protein 9, mitochondrial n=1 Tax=Emergomyces pasteurianus Ep9510 TaxID=1447872 RepID=A0A1J9PL39_9EURO|nr:hypothetical protein AJ78_02669 [Emergomyces pasteurianus Ep9510]
MSVSLSTSSSLPAASAMTRLLRSFLGATNGRCSSTPLCRRCTTIHSSAKIWQPPPSRYFSKSRSILSSLAEPLEQSSASYSPATNQPPRKVEPQSDPDNNSNFHSASKSTIRSSRFIPKRDAKTNAPRNSKLATHKPEKPATPRELEPWQIQKLALKKKFPEGWNPRKRLHPDTLDTIRHLHQQDPTKYSTPVLAQEYKVSPEAIRRILKSKWQPSADVAAERRERWEKRRKRIWNQLAEIGVRPHRPSFADVSDTKILDGNPRKIGPK